MGAAEAQWDQEWRPWRSGQGHNSFGLLFVNVGLCLVPALCVFGVRILFWLWSRCRKQNYRHESPPLVTTPKVATAQKENADESVSPETILRSHSEKQGKDRNVQPFVNTGDAEQGEGSEEYILKQSWSHWRNLSGFGFAAVSTVLFTGLMLASQINRNSEDYLMPWSESIGFLTMALSAFVSTSFYRSGVQRQSKSKEIPFLDLTRRLWILRVSWLLMLVLSVFRLASLISIWAYEKRYKLVWNIVLLLGECLQIALILLASIFCWFVGGKREDSEKILANAFPNIRIEPEFSRCGPIQPDPSEELAGVTSTLTFDWLTKLVWIARKKVLSINDVFTMQRSMKSAHLYARFHHYWVKHQGSTFLLGRTIWRFLKFKFLCASGFKLLYDTLLMLNPLFLNLLVTYMTNDKDSSKLRGVLFVALLGFNALSETCLLHQYFHLQMRLGISIRSVLSTAIYEKALTVDRNTLTEEMVEKVSSGKIINLMSVDTQRLGDLMSYVQILWSAPYQITIICVLLYKQLGVAALAGIGLLVISIPLTSEITRQVRKIQKTLMKAKDDRTRFTSEALSGIRAVKLYAWEEAKIKEINSVRNKELNLLWRSQLVLLINRVQTFAVPVFVAIISFSVYTKVLGHTMTPAITFTSLALFNMLRFPLIVLPNVIMSVAEALVTISRIQEFLLLPETKNRQILPSSTQLPAISIQNLRITYGRPTPVISDLNLTVANGDFVCVTGRTGCGKTTLLNALLCDVEADTGGTEIRGSIAYCAQNAWIQSGSVRSNILFGSPFDQCLYDETIQACALVEDLAILPNGDETEIGERGVNLSGGQKQRIALARAVYRNADVYLLDDVLSAVDPHVAEHIFREVFGRVLKGKTRLLVTHRTEFLNETTTVAFLHGDGNTEVFNGISEAKENPDFFAFCAEQPQQEDEVSRVGDTPERENTEANEVITESPSFLGSSLSREDAEFIEGSRRKSSRNNSASRKGSSGSIIDPTNNKLIDEEKIAEGAVAWSVYANYFKAGGLVCLAALLTFIIGSQTLSVLGGFWLSKWTEDAALDNPKISETRGLLVYSIYQVCYVLAMAVGIFLLAVFSQAAAKFFHEQLLQRTIRSTLTFIDRTPLGRLNNRFSKDVYVVDESIPQTIFAYLSNVVLVGSVIIVICIVLPVLIALVVPMMAIYWVIEKLYVAVARQIKRIDAVTRSPLFSHFTETLEGIRTIKAFQETERFQLMNLRLVDTNLSAAYVYVGLNRWLAVRLETIGSVLVFGVALSSVLSKGKLPAALCGLAISYAISVTNSLNWLVRMSGERESNIVSVERIAQLNDDEECPQEQYMTEKEGVSEPASELIGEIEFRDVYLRYRKNLPYALKGVSFVVRPREKVGVVGRTGAGKSSLLQCLLKVVLISRGDIFLNGSSIVPLSVTELRKSISIIPQEPFLFTCSLRDNLDPFHECTDDQIWQALRRACLYDMVNTLTDGLNHYVAESGANFSAGQRQLLCLARVLLKDSHILLLDEATSAVDPLTDSLIQRTIQSEFQNCTVLTIAHRLKTVVDYDKILVMSGGKVAEFDSPSSLLANPSSIFYSMMYLSNPP